MVKLPREEWQAALTSLPKSDLANVVTAIPESWTIAPLVLPQAGLAMLKMCESVQHDNFNLGEIPLTQVSLRVTTPSGFTADGGALLMDDDLQYAEHLALCDAILAGELPGYEKVAALLVAGQKLRATLAAERKSYLAKTKVNFSRLEEAGEYSA